MEYFIASSKVCADAIVVIDAAEVAASICFMVASDICLAVDATRYDVVGVTQVGCVCSWSVELEDTDTNKHNCESKKACSNDVVAFCVARLCERRAVRFFNFVCLVFHGCVPLFIFV